MLVDPTFYISMAQDESSYTIGIYVFLIIGALMFIVGFLGCTGVIKESQGMLVLVCPNYYCRLSFILSYFLWDRRKCGIYTLNGNKTDYPCDLFRCF